MVQKLPRDLVAEQAIIHVRPPVGTVVDRTFELPAFLYGTTAALYLCFIAVMTAGFAAPGLQIPAVIFALFVVAGFGTPALWTRMGPGRGREAMTWWQFRRDGIATLTGRLTAGEACAQMLILPVLILVWGIAIVTIAALV